MPCAVCVSYHPPLPLYRKTRESSRQRDILLASMRTAETGRGSEQCQQIREVQKPQQEACQSSSITRASETQGKTWELLTVQECHPLQQRIHKRHQIKPRRCALFYSRNTPVGKAICQVNKAPLCKLMHQRAGYRNRTCSFPHFFACVLMFYCKHKNTIYNFKNPAGSQLGTQLVLHKSLALIWQCNRQTKAHIHSELSKGETDRCLCNVLSKHVRLLYDSLEWLWNSAYSFLSCLVEHLDVSVAGW